MVSEDWGSGDGAHAHVPGAGPVRGLRGTRQGARALPGVLTRGRCATANHAARDEPSLGTVSIISYVQNNAQTA